MSPSVKQLIEQKDIDRLRELLAAEPNLANEGITIPFESLCFVKAHPLHRICDAVFAHKMTDEEAIEIARVFLENGANIDGDRKGGTPLLAAASLHAEQLGIFYIDNGADLDFTDESDDASALHWAAFCGRDKLVNKLIESNAKFDELDKTYNCTPLAWAIHCMMSDDVGNKHNQPACIKLLINAGSDMKKLSPEHTKFLLSLAEGDNDLTLLSGK